MYKLPVDVYYSLLPLEELCFLSGQKMAAYPCLTLFTCTSCFQLPASTCRTPSSCTEIGSCFKNQQESDLGLRQRLLQLGTRILHQFSFLIFSPLKFLVPHPWRGFWSLIFFSPWCVHPPNLSPSLNSLSMAILECLNISTNL